MQLRQQKRPLIIGSFSLCFFVVQGCLYLGLRLELLFKLSFGGGFRLDSLVALRGGFRLDSLVALRASFFGLRNECRHFAGQGNGG